MLAAVLLLAFALTACRGTGAQAPELLVPIAVQTRDDTAIVTRGEVTQVARFYGVTRADVVYLNFGAITGRLYGFQVLPGDTVYEGQLLARLDFSHIRERITRQEDHMANIRIRNSFNNRLRTLDLDIRSHINEQALQSARDNNNMTALAQAEAEARAIEIARLDLNFDIQRQNLTLRHEQDYLNGLRQQYMRGDLHAPVAGVVTFKDVDARAGSWIAPFFDIMGITPTGAPVFIEYIGVSSALPTHGAARLRAHIGTAAYDISRVAITREDARRFARPPIRFTFDGDVSYPPGHLVVIYIYEVWERDVLKIPRGALLQSPDIGFYAYRIVDSQLTMTYLTVGRRTATYAVIAGGLEEGDIVYVRR